MQVFTGVYCNKECSNKGLANGNIECGNAERGNSTKYWGGDFQGVDEESGFLYPFSCSPRTKRSRLVVSWMESSSLWARKVAVTALMAEQTLPSATLGQVGQSGLSTLMADWFLQMTAAKRLKRQHKGHLGRPQPQESLFSRGSR